MEVDSDLHDPWVHFEHRGRSVSCPEGQEPLVIDYIDTQEYDNI